jgi:hypothetical protein
MKEITYAQIFFFPFLASGLILESLWVNNRNHKRTLDWI